MKKSLIALAALAAAGAASAQSSVTLFGIVDAVYQNTRADRAPNATSPDTEFKQSRIHNSGYNSSRLGFRGTEDLGGGMSASFWLEAGINNDDGTGQASSSTNQNLAPFSGTTGARVAVRSGTQGMTFNRRATVSLAGGWGELRIGRDYVPSFWNHTVFDPFGTNGSGSHSNISLAMGGALGVQTVVRASNSIGYFLPPNLGGFYGQVMYAMGENVAPVVPRTNLNATTAQGNNFGATEDEGRHIGLRLGFASGPFNVAAAYGRTKVDSSVAIGAATLDATGTLYFTTGAPVTPADINALAGEYAGSYDYVNQNVAGQWDFGMAKLLAAWNQEKIRGTGDLAGAKHTTWMIGTLVPVGAGEIRASYVRGKESSDFMRGNQIALGYVHNLSKRTAVYTTFSRISNSSQAELNYSLNGITPTGAGGDARAFDIGVRHSF